MRLELLGYRIDIKSLAEIKKARELHLKTSPGKPSRRASREFWDAFSHGSTIVAQCRCGVTHFPTNTTLDYEDGELEELLEKEKADPKGYRSDWENDGIGLIEGPTGLIAWDCPCRSDAAIENMLVEYQQDILDYYRRRLKAASRKVDELGESINAASNG